MQGNYQYYESLGHPSMKQRQGDTPVFSIYAIQKDGSFKLIAINTDRNAVNSKWVIKKTRVHVTRFWDASTFYAMLQTQAPNPDGPIPELPKVDGKRLQQEDDIIIFARYFNQVDAAGSNYGRQYPLFIGSIDTIAEVGTARGAHTVEIQGRDRMKWLMDSTISFNAVTDGNPSRITPSDLDPNDKNGVVARSDIILEIAQRGIGFIPNINTGCPRSIEEGAVQDVSDDQPGETSKGEAGNDKIGVEDPNFHYTNKVDENVNLSNLGRLYYDYNSAKQANTTLKNPQFHLYVTRPGFSKADEAIGGVGINVVDQTPIDYIKYLAQHEIYPTQLFQDNKNGCLYYTPRLNDTVGLAGVAGLQGLVLDQTAAQYTGDGDPQSSGVPERLLNDARMRLYRTYYYRPEYAIASKKKGDPNIDLRQEIRELKEEESSLSVRSDYIIGNSQASDSRKDIQLHFKVKPSSWEGKDYPCRFKQISDQLIDNVAEAGAIAAAFASIFSRDTRAGMMAVQGDPTLSPGECVQIRGSLKTQDYTANDYFQELSSFLASQSVLNQSIFELQAKVLGVRLDEQKRREEKAKEDDITAFGVGNSDNSDGGGEITAFGFSSGSSDSASSSGSSGSSDTSEIPKLDGSGDTQKIQNLADANNYNDLIAGVKSGDRPNFLASADPPSIYRVESVTHHLNDEEEGYVTKAALLSPY